MSLNELKKRNIKINGMRTSVRLEPQVWEILHDVAHEIGCDVNRLCEFIFERKSEESSLSSAIRVFLISYLNIKCKKDKQ
ncbi:MAG: ribbon-helix-helix domain-containing protein [Alphaproteobacteria bacterium]|nr:ribbon-helix-helix domain-containing protein [Alphaproteobacteria bacterium]